MAHTLQSVWATIFFSNKALSTQIGTTPNPATGLPPSGPAILTKNVRKAALPKKIVFPQKSQYSPQQIAQREASFKGRKKIFRVA